MVFPHCIFKTSGGSYIVCTFWLNVVFVVVIYVYASLNPNIIMHILLLHVAEMMGRSFAWLISHHLQQIRYELRYYHPVYIAQLNKRRPGLPSWR